MNDQAKSISVGDLLKEAFERSGVASPNLERGKVCQWMSREMEVDKPSPLNPAMVVIAIFHDESTIRVYEVQRLVEGAKVSIAPRRVNLTKAADTFVVEEMTFDRMVDLLAEELSILEGAIGTAERERNAVLDLGKSLPPEYPLRKFLEDLENEEHLVQDEEEQEAENASPATASAPS